MSSTSHRELVTLEIGQGAKFESQSGLHSAAPRIYGSLCGPKGGKVAGLIMHPTSNFMGHYLLDPCQKLGLPILALNTRFVNNDTTLTMERTLEDVGAGVRFLKKHFERVVLIGNSGGASLMAFYQAQAERPFIHNTPAGDPISLTMEQCPPGDGIAILAGHPGRSHLMAHWIDPSVIEERDSLSAFPALNLFEPGRGVPFDAEFLEEYRSEQRARIERITAYAHRRLQYLRSLAEPIQDEALVVYRTYADPRFLDLTLDSNDRAIGGNRAGSDGSTKSTNNAVSTLARFSSLTGWLSQWSSESRADGPTNLAKTSVPVLQMEYTADASIFPSDVSRWSASCPGRETSVRVPRGTHYLKNQPELIELVASTVSDWANEIGPVQPHIASLEHS